MTQAQQNEETSSRNSVFRNPVVVAALVTAVATVLVAIIQLAVKGADDRTSPSGSSTSPTPEALRPPNPSTTDTNTDSSASSSATQPQSPTPSRKGTITLPHDFFAGYSVDLDATEPDWRFSPDQYREGIDLVANCCDSGLTARGGILLLDKPQANWTSVEVREQCAAATGFTKSEKEPRKGNIFCLKTDEARIAVARIVDAGLDSGKVTLEVVVW